MPRLVLYLALLATSCLALSTAGCQQKASKATKTSFYARSALDSFPLLQDQRWAWGMGSPTLLLRGHMTPDKQEDVIVVAEAVVRRGWPWQHFFLLRGPGLSPDAISAPVLMVAAGVKGFRWGQKILRPTSAKVIDVNGDGHRDVVVGYRNGRVAIFFGDGKGKRWELGHVLSCERIWAFQGAHSYVGDWDGDKRLDVVTLGRSGHIMLWRQTQKGRFVPQHMLRGLSRLPANYQRLLQQWPQPKVRKSPQKKPILRGKQAAPVVRLRPSSRPVVRPTKGPQKPLKARPMPRRPVASRPALRATGAARRPLLRAPTKPFVPRWSSLRVLYEALPLELDGDGALDLLLVGGDRDGRVWLWPLLNRKRGDASMGLGRRKPLVASWPSSNPIASPRLTTMPGRSGPTLFALTSAYGYLNSRGVALLRQFAYVPPRKPLRDPFGMGKQRLIYAHSLSFGLASGNFGVPGMAVVSPASVVVFPYKARAQTRRYDLRRDPLLRGRISLRSAIGCDLAGKGQDALVMLGIGSVQKRQRLGVHLLIHRKPLLKPLRLSQKPR